MANDSVSFSWFAVFNNPYEHGYAFDGGVEPEQLRQDDEASFNLQVRKLLEKLRDEWKVGESSPKSHRTGAWSYCISADGLHHVHMVLEDSISMRWSKIKASYCQGMHFEPTKGTKKQALDYINKCGEFAEKGEHVVDTIFLGDIHSNQGHRSDLDEIQDLLDSGKHPRDIISMSVRYARLQKCIRTYYLEKKKRDTKVFRNVSVHWLFGFTGTGKTYSYVELCDKYGEDNVYRVTNYEHPFDGYYGEKIIFFDEFRGEIKYSHLLNYIDKYKSQLPARYKDSVSLFDTVYFSSPLLPQEVYSEVFKNEKYDNIAQLMRRIDDITYFYKEGGDYRRVTVPVVDCEVHSRSEFYKTFSNDDFSEYNNFNNVYHDNFVEVINDALKPF